MNASPARDTRKLPLDVATSAALPVDASGELESMVTVMAPPETLALIVGSCGNDDVEGDDPEDDDDGDVGLPPHPAIAEAMAASDMAWPE